MFRTQEECEVAFFAGKFSYYQPKFFSHKGDNPVNGVTRTRMSLPGDACVLMSTYDGKKFVILQKGTNLRWEKEIPYALDACGNKIFSLFYPRKKTTSETEIPKKMKYTEYEDNSFSSPFYDPEPGVEPQAPYAPYREQGEKGDPGPAGRDGKVIVESSNTGWIVAGVVAVVAAVVYIFSRTDDPAPVAGVGPGGNTGHAF